MSFLKALPWGFYAALVGILFALWLAHAWAESIRNTQAAKDAAALTAAQNQIALTQSANDAAAAAIKALQDKLQQCEAGRVADAQRDKAAAAQHDKDVAANAVKDASAHAKTQKLLATTCADWAKLPACGVQVQQ